MAYIAVTTIDDLKNSTKYPVANASLMLLYYIATCMSNRLEPNYVLA